MIYAIESSGYTRLFSTAKKASVYAVSIYDAQWPWEINAYKGVLDKGGLDEYNIDRVLKRGEYAR